MSTTAAPAPAPVQPPSAAPASRWRRWLLPSLGDQVFMFTLYWMFLSSKDGFRNLLTDGDIGWHIRAGQWMLAHGQVPHTDLFSFTKYGQPWFAWEWLSDVLFGWLEHTYGFKGVVLLAGIVIGLTGMLLFRWVIARGANGLVALAVTLLAFGAATIHFHARPHVFSLLFLLGSAWLISSARERPTRWIWALVPLQVLWTNLHGAFALLILVLGTSAFAAAAETWLGWRERTAGWALARTHAGVAVLCVAATLVNPYGYHLHQHIAAYLSSDWIQTMVQEFQAPHFRSESLRQYELLLLTAIAVTVPLLQRRNLYDVLLLWGFAHLSLTSMRHVPLFVLLASPVVAAELSAWWRRYSRGMAKSSVAHILQAMGEDIRVHCRHVSVWPALFLGVMILLPSSVVKWPTDFPKEMFPIETVAQWNALLTRTRVLTADQWGDYLIYRNYPQQRVFFDGRSDFFGEKLGREYLQIIQARHGWEDVLRRYQVETVLCPVDWPLVELLKRSPGWRVLADNGKAILFLRSDLRLGSQRTLMTTSTAAEGSTGDKLR